MATPHPPNPRSLFTPKSAEIPLADRPLTLDFTLPDHTRARVVEVDTFDSIHVFLPSGSAASGAKDDDDAEHIAEWHREDGKGDKEKTSLHGVVQEHRAVWEDVWTLTLGEAEGATAEAIEGLMRHIWVSVYACEWADGQQNGRSMRPGLTKSTLFHTFCLPTPPVWLRRDPYERLPVRVGGTEAQKKLVHEYLVHTGLAFPAPEAKQPDNLLLVKAAFYQGECTV